ncbi:uncharacterized protein [Antedon mediterranea]|uniref:uncharacterized protein n=1 Tax=Antedon mediterranea TaxID=105859 RepID=UPI003AF98F8C
MGSVSVKLNWTTRYLGSVIFLCILLFDALHLSICCKDITRYWRPMPIDDRTELANIVASGVVVRTFYNQEDNPEKVYAAEVYFDEIYKGINLVKNITTINGVPPTYRVEDFGQKRYCKSPVVPGEHYIFFLKVVANTGGGKGKGESVLHALYDDPTGAVADFDYATEAIVLRTIGWRNWIAWTPCSRDCGGGVRRRRRICVRDFADACEGKALEIQHCNKFKCEGNQDLIKLLSLSSLPSGVQLNPPRQQIGYYRIDRSAILRMKTSDLFGSTFPTSFSIIMTIKPRLSDDQRHLYVLQMVDSSGFLQLGIRISDNPSLVYSQKDGLVRKEISLSFPINMLDRKWHKLAFSIKGSEVTLYGDCAYVYNGEMEVDNLAIDPEGTTSLGSATSLNRDMYYEGDIIQLIIDDDPNAAALHCPRDNRSVHYPQIPPMFDNMIYPQVSDVAREEPTTKVTKEPPLGLPSTTEEPQETTAKESNPMNFVKKPDIKPTRNTITYTKSQKITSRSVENVEVIDEYIPTQQEVSKPKDESESEMEEEDSVSNFSFDNIFEDNQDNLGNLFSSETTESRSPTVNFVGLGGRRGDVQDIGSGDDLETLQWMEWGVCTQTCGSGVKLRLARCPPNSKHERCAHGQTMAREIKRCVLPACNEVFIWSPWTYCSKTCGDGVRQRVGFCYPSSSDKICLDNGPGTVIDRRNCNEKACEEPCHPGCKNGGRCNYYTGTCLCNVGFYGKHCEHNLCDEPCKFGGRCVAKNYCSCPYGFLPPFCRPICDPPCYNEGVCVYKDQCSCKQGWKGPNCLAPICKDFCLNGGRCVGPDRCVCRSGYTGDNCATPICRPVCENGGECISPYFCKCQSGTKGQRCSVKYCERFCRNGGKCIGANKCDCPRGYGGQFCQTQISKPPNRALPIRHQTRVNTGLAGRNQYYPSRGGRPGHCRYESYTMSFKRGYAHKVQKTYEEDCGPWTNKKCTRTKYVYEYVYKQFYRTAYRCIQPS